MRLWLRQFIGALTLLIGLGSSLSGCARRCQPAAQEPFTTITGTEWRLIRTTNPRLQKDVSRFTFPIMVFKTEFQGEFYQVVNNRRFDTPVYTFQYNVQSEGRSGLVRIVYSTVTGDAIDSGGTVDPSNIGTPAVSKPIDYFYELRANFTLVERNTGYLYEFLPFVGVVDPDSTCTF